MKKLNAIIAMVAAAVIIPAALLAWGPDTRATYTAASPAKEITFNSITDNPNHGDERNFVQVRDANSGNETYVDSISLTAGHEYVVYMYYHNNAAQELGLVATGSYAKAQIPAVVSNGSTGTKAVGYIGATNSKPLEVWDDISFSNTTGSDMALQFVPGSATIHNLGATNGFTMADTIVTTGAPIGFHALDGFVPGCDQFAGFVTFRVKAGQPNFTITKQVRKTGTTSFVESVAVNPSDSVDYLITYRNTGTITQNNVVISDVLPAGAEYVVDSTYLSNSTTAITNPSGLKVSNNIITTTGINIGNYAPGAAAYIKFSATIAANADLPTCDVNTLKNSATAYTDNGSKEDTADVTVTKTCTPVTPPVTPPVVPLVTPEELPVTGAGETFATILGLGASITSLGYYLASRRALLNR